MELRVEGVRKRFGASLALDRVDLTIAAGTHVLLAGANGAGKTTLLRLLAGLTGPTEGRIRLDGDDPRRSRARRCRLGLLSHQTLLYDDLTAAENLAFFANLYGASPAAPEVALERVGLSAQARSRVGGFSRGMKQRLALARATLHEPEVLLLDEPFTGLDRRSSRALSTHLMRRAESRQTTSVLVTHKVEEAAELANRVVVLRSGLVACDESWSGDGIALQALCDAHQEGAAS